MTGSKKVLVLSETIFSDRLIDTMKFAEMEGAKMVPFTLQKLNKFETKYKVALGKGKFNSLRWKTVRFWRQLARYVAPAGVDTTSLDDHYAIDRHAWGWRKRLSIAIISQILKSSKQLRRLALCVVTWVTPIPEGLMEQEFGDFDAILVFSLGNLRSGSILPIVKYFRSLKRPVFTYVQSWDNPTTKGYRSICPDKVLCWTELMRDELVTYMDIPRDATDAVGVPLFTDMQFSSNSHKKHILFATKSPKSYCHNPDLTALIGAFAKSLDMDFTVRIHPLSLNNAFVNELNRIRAYSVDLDFKVIYPDQDENGAILNQDYEHQSAEVFESANAFISIYSTMNLEAVNAGKATINIDFELGEIITETKRHNIKIDRRQIHNQRVMSYGNIQNVQSVDELYQALLKFKENGHDADGDSTVKLIETECRPIYNYQKVNEIILKILGR